MRLVGSWNAPDKVSMGSKAGVVEIGGGHGDTHWECATKCAHI
jgi:hypothetical protein